MSASDPRDREHSEPLAANQGESEGRRRGLDEGGGQPLTEELEDGELRGVDEEGKPTTGTHGGPKKQGDPRAPERKAAEKGEDEE